MDGYSGYFRRLGYDGVLYALVGGAECLCVYSVSKSKLVRLIEVKGSMFTLMMPEDPVLIEIISILCL